MKTIRDFTSREEFVRSLNLWHYDKNTSQREFTKISNVKGFETELKNIRDNIDLIGRTWNNQSIEQIEAVVSNQGAFDLEIMQGQKKDKLDAGYRLDQPMYRIRQCSNDSIFYSIAKDIGLDYPCARYHVQFPGEVTVFHTDIFSPAHEFLPDIVKNRPEEEIGLDNGIRRVLIALEDWDWGQILMFGTDTWKQWNAGDMIYWEYGVPHCASNMGYSPRISVSITGLVTEKFNKIFNKK